MPRGKKTSPEAVYAIMASWAMTNNYSETAKELNIPVNTVKDTVKKHENEPEFVKLRNQKKEDFAEKATEIINLAFKRLNEALGDDTNNIPINHLTTVIGTLFDKRALVQGDATENIAVEVKLPPGVDEYAG